MPSKTPKSMLLAKIFSRISSGESNAQSIEAKLAEKRDHTVSVNQLRETLQKIVESQPERIALESDRLKNKNKSPSNDRESENQSQNTDLKNMESVCAKRHKRFYFTKAAARFRDLDLLIGANVMNVKESAEERSCHEGGSDTRGKECSNGNVNQNRGVSVKSMPLEKVESAQAESVYTSKGVLSVHRGEFSPRDIRKLDS